MTLDLIAKVGGLDRGMSQAERIAQTRAKNIERTFVGLQRAVTGVFTFFAGSAVVGAITRSIELGDELEKAATIAGVTGEAISELSYAAKLSDVDLGSLSTSLRFMQKNLSEANSGAKGANETLAALGLTIGEIRGLKADQQFEIIADRISKLRDESDKARAATEVFGRAGAALLPLFEQGADGIRKAREEAQRLGLSFGDDQLKTLADADLAIKKLSASWEGFATILTIKVAPAITGALELLQGRAPGVDPDPIKRRIEQLKKEVADLEDFDPLNVREGLREKSIERVTARIAEARAELKKLRTETSTGRGGSGEPSLSVPGFAAAIEAETKKVKAADDGLTEIIVSNARVRTDAYADWLQSLEKDTRTSVQASIESLNEFEAKLDVLVLEQIVDPEEAALRMREAVDGVLQEIEPLGSYLGDQAKKEIEKTSEFMLEAARGTQDILADTLFGAMEGKIDNVGKAFVRMINQLVAEALAAKLAEKLFGNVSGDSAGGGGFLDKALAWGAGFFGGGRASGGAVSAGMLYRVNETGEPEALRIPGRADYLMTGSRSGTVIRGSQVDQDGRGSNVFNVMLPRDANVTRKTGSQIAQETSRAVRRAERLA